MSGNGETEGEELDFIVVGFEDEDCIVSPTSPIEPEKLSSLMDREVEYEDFKGVIWKGKVVEVVGEDMLRVRFSQSAISEGGPSGLGQGSLVRIKTKK